MLFQPAYLQAMRDRAPRMFNELTRSGAMPKHLQEKTQEAYRLKADLMKGFPTTASGIPLDPAAERAAEEHVFAVMLDFPNDETTSSALSRTTARSSA